MTEVGPSGWDGPAGLGERFSGSRESCSKWQLQSMAGGFWKAARGKRLTQQPAYSSCGDQQAREPA
jgi:hypothetical protein